MTFHGPLGILYLKLLSENIFFDHFTDTSGLWTIVVESLIQRHRSQGSCCRLLWVYKAKLNLSLKKCVTMLAFSHTYTSNMDKITSGA